MPCLKWDICFPLWKCWKAEEPDFSFIPYLQSTQEICQVISLYEKKFEYHAHLREYIKGRQTILQETSDPREIFQVIALQYGEYLKSECSRVQFSDTFSCNLV